VSSQPDPSINNQPNLNQLAGVTEHGLKRNNKQSSHGQVTRTSYTSEQNSTNRDWYHEGLQIAK
jgi:hypothetical protein